VTPVLRRAAGVAPPAYARRQLAHGKRGRVGLGDATEVRRTFSADGAVMTAHPMRGAAIGDTPADGVVDHRGEVFGHPNLFVADGAVIPAAIGRNPSMTIAAVAERSAALMTS
jgi:cholesterol oxidase